MSLMLIVEKNILLLTNQDLNELKRKDKKASAPPVFPGDTQTSNTYLFVSLKQQEWGQRTGMPNSSSDTHRRKLVSEHSLEDRTPHSVHNEKCFDKPL